MLVRAEVYERFKSLFEEDPVTEQERMFQLQQFGERAGWDDPEMAIYDELVGLLNRAERVARLVKVPNCGSGCRGFESRHSPNTSPCEVTTYKGLLFAFPAWAGQTAPGNHPAVSNGGQTGHVRRGRQFNPGAVRPPPAGLLGGCNAFLAANLAERGDRGSLGPSAPRVEVRPGGPEADLTYIKIPSIVECRFRIRIDRPEAGEV